MAKMIYAPSKPVIKKPIPAAAARADLSAEDKSKDAFFIEVANITEAMIARHGKDFAMGTLVLSARFVAENKPLVKKDSEELAT